MSNEVRSDTAEVQDPRFTEEPTGTAVPATEAVMPDDTLAAVAVDTSGTVTEVKLASVEDAAVAAAEMPPSNDTPDESPAPAAEVNDTGGPSAEVAQALPDADDTILADAEDTVPPDLIEEGAPEAPTEDLETTQPITAEGADAGSSTSVAD